MPAIYDYVVTLRSTRGMVVKDYQIPVKSYNITDALQQAMIVANATKGTYGSDVSVLSVDPATSSVDITNLRTTGAVS